MLITVSRAIGLFFATFTLLNLALGLAGGLVDANHWWFDFRPLPGGIGRLMLLGTATLVGAWAIWPNMPPWRRSLTLAGLTLLSIVAAWNIIGFYTLLARAVIGSGFPVPLSLLTGASLFLVGHSVYDKSQAHMRWAVLIVTLGACAISMPLMQIVFFGNTDYRRRADVAVVFGARAYADGSASDALSDRVRAACSLYHDGMVRRLIFSGGPGDGAIHETQAMKDLAIKLGVPEEAILLDPHGLNTAATVRSCTTIIRRISATRVLAVSHFYHLPRIKLEFERAGLEVYTVPAPQGRPLQKLPTMVAREVVALWVYFLKSPGVSLVT